MSTTYESLQSYFEQPFLDAAYIYAAMLLLQYKYDLYKVENLKNWKIEKIKKV